MTETMTTQGQPVRVGDKVAFLDGWETNVGKVLHIADNGDVIVFAERGQQKMSVWSKDLRDVGEHVESSA